MATLSTSTQDEIQRLLELFPLSALKLTWPELKGNKDELCDAVAKQADYKRISAFILKNFSRCRQHVYLLSETQDGMSASKAFPEVDLLVSQGKDTLIYLAKVSYTVFLDKPYEQVPVTFLWPVRINTQAGATVVSCVVLERDPRPEEGRNVIKSVRAVEEKTVVSYFAEFGFSPLDLNKGVKALWKDDYMDAFYTKFKKPNSTTTEAMDLEQGIKKTNPALYAEMQSRPLLDTSFRIDPIHDSAVKTFHVNPTSGKVGFSSYTEAQGGSDAIVQEILARNS